jgi:hypothetical protein
MSLFRLLCIVLNHHSVLQSLLFIFSLFQISQTTVFPSQAAMYRTQSCPGILSAGDPWQSASGLSSTLASGGPCGATRPSPCSDEDGSAVGGGPGDQRRRRRRRGADEEDDSLLGRARSALHRMKGNRFVS